MSCCGRRDGEDAAQSSILFSILNSGAPCARRRLQTAAAHRLCSCASKGRLVAIRAPRLVFKAACEVLVKTFRFVKNVPCFRGLPTEDQLRLVRKSWAPLLVLGMVQDSVDFDTVETQQPSLLHRILTHSKEPQQRTATEIQDPGVPVGDVEGIKMFLVKCRGLRISVKEYAFLKGAILFTPEVMELECRDYIRALQREAERALYEHVRTVHRGRVSRLRALLDRLRSMDPQAVAGLFFRPVTGTSSIDEHVLSLFYER
ncbi:nuclear receptor subfamily 0 group B member 1-like [Trachinotus anak]|uniref:nuclear receptor subfamily 0 group B member 1-like n=1 Tax=Trachinotus anak TaxID=443729 RepID=UPI0039F1A75D